MKGEGEVGGVRDFSSSRSSCTEGVISGSNFGRQGREEDGHSLYKGMLSHLSRNGLSMLAGGGFSLKPLAAGMPTVRNWASHERAPGAVPGGGFTGFTGYRAVRPAVSPMGLRLEAGASSSHRGSSIENQPDVHKLTTDECWRLILKHGTQWPAWNGAATPSLATQGLMKEKVSAFEVSDHGHASLNKEKPLQQPQDFLKLLATRALEALAQSPPDHYGKAAAGGMLAPKQITQEVMDSKASGDAPETPTKVTEPTPSAKAPSSSREVRAPKTIATRPRTAALTIFYDGIVNVCDNVPADKARVIMMFAEKAGVSLNAQALLRNVKCVTPSPSRHNPSTAIPQEDLHHSKPSSAPSDPPVEGSVPSDQEPAECSNSPKMAIFQPYPKPFKITMITTEGNSRRNVIVKPLPNARKNSLARFLDSRKRSRETASCSEGGSPKKQALGDGCCPSDSDQELNATNCGKSPMPSSCSRSFDSKEGVQCANCHKASRRAITSDAEMKDSLVE